VYRDGERSLLAVMYCTMFSWYGTMLVASQKFFSLIPRSSASCNSLSSIVRNGILSIFLYYLLRIFPTQVNVPQLLYCGPGKLIDVFVLCIGASV